MTLHFKEIRKPEIREVVKKDSLGSSIVIASEGLSGNYDVCPNARQDSGCEDWKDKKIFNKYCGDNYYLCKKHGGFK